MLRAVAFGNHPCIRQLAEFGNIESHREGLDRVAIATLPASRLHQSYDKTGIHAAGQLHTQRHIGHQLRIDGVV